MAVGQQSAKQWCSFLRQNRGVHGAVKTEDCEMGIAQHITHTRTRQGSWQAVMDWN